MSPDEHAHLQELEATVKRYRARIVTLKELNGDLLAGCKAALGAFTRNDAIDWSDLERAIAKADAHGSRGFLP